MHKPLPHRNDIQGLRAIAVIRVVACHLGIPGFSAGFVGVDIFFVISGYVISGLILNQLNSESGFSYFQFYARRLQRLFPALFFMLSVVSVISYFTYPPKSQGEWGI